MKIAVVGLGFMGSTHVRALRSVPGVELAAVVSSDAAKLSGDLTAVRGNLGEAGGIYDFSSIRKYHDIHAALEDSEIDAVDICLPSDQHVETARAALRAGKHVLVEKPLALDGDSADALIDEAHRVGRILMAGHVLRFVAAYQGLREILQVGRLGRVCSAFFRRRCGAPTWSRWMTDPRRSGGAVIDLLIHDIDFCLYLFGKPEFVSAVGLSDLDHGIDWTEARLEYSGIGPVIITGGWHHPKSYPFTMEFTVISEGGTLEFRSGGEPLTLFDAAGSSEKVGPAEHDPFVEELTYFVKCAQQGQRTLLCAPEESAVAVKLARCLLESRERGGKRIACQF